MENQYEQGEVTAEYIYTQMKVEALAFADGYIASNCASGTAEICDKLLNIYGNGVAADELTSDDIFALMQAIEASTMAGDSVDDEGNRLWGSTLMQAAADCSALWYKDLRDREGNIAADQKIKDDIQSGQFQEMLEKSGVDPVQYLVDTGFDMKFKTDQATHSQVQNIMGMSNKNDQANEFVKMLVKLDSDGNPIVQNGKYVLDEEKEKNLLQSMVKIGNDRDIDGNSWEALSVALHASGVRADYYQEHEVVMNYANNGIIVDDRDNNGVLDLNDIHQMNLFGNNLFGTVVFYEDLGQKVNGQTSSNVLGTQNSLEEIEDNNFILGDYTRNNQSHVIFINNNLQGTDQEYKTFGHETTHSHQYENIYKLINYGKDSKGNLVASDCLDQKQCRGTLWQYVNIRRSNSKNYATNTVIAPSPVGSIELRPYIVSPMEQNPQIVSGAGYREYPNIFIVPFTINRP